MNIGRKFAALEEKVTNLSASVFSELQGSKDVYMNIGRKFAALEEKVTNLSASVFSELQGSKDVYMNIGRKFAALEEKVTNLSASVFSELQGSKDVYMNIGRKFAALEEKVTNLSASVFLELQGSKAVYKEVEAEIKKLQASIINAESQLGFVTASQSKACCPDGWVYRSMSCYLFSSSKMEWHAAQDDCRSKQAMLAVINDRTEWDFVRNWTIPTYYWIGLTDEHTGRWEWVDGTPFTVDHKEWMPGQPDDWKNHSLGGGEDCAHLHGNGKYNDDHCTRKYQFVCERKLG
ncbi:C-type lectin domain family 10 member A-like [Polyodon spathula]|uniref:C-type lectin domain family 10 member A-like n=1 Tax=Polyodon spathula TaxID=7913 RepID=UPI001B7DA9A3|nr:C-type lectin domain family 10 member A-like [Polyodon spathula]